MDNPALTSRIVSVGSRVVAVLVALVLIPVVVVARERGATGGFKEAPTITLSGIARVLVPTEPPTDPDVDPTRWVVQQGNAMIPIDDEDARGLVPGQVVRAKYSPQDGVQKVVRAAGVTRPHAPIAQRHLLVVPVEWGDRTMSAARLAGIAKAASELTTWWSAASGGVETLTVRVAPVLAVTPTKVCDDSGVADQVQGWVSRSEYAAWVTNTTLLWPENSGCWYGGLGQMPGYFTWMNKPDASVWAHELGHNMGLPHANSCGMLDPADPQFLKSALPGYLSKCVNNEYGNIYDLMGSSYNLASGYNAQYLYNVGWLSEGQLSTWDGVDRTYRLSLLSSTSGATRAVRIPPTKSLGSFDEGEFWMQYRAKDNSFFVANVPGVVLTMNPSAEYLEGLGYKRDTTGGDPWSTNWTDGSWLCPINAGAAATESTRFVLKAGTPFDDRLGRFRISLVSITADFAEVRVQPGAARTVVNATGVTTVPEVDSLGNLTGGLKVSWAASSAIDNTGAEPSLWTATVSPGGASCSVPVFRRSCTVRRVPRSQPLTVSVIGTTPVGQGTATGPPVEAVPFTPPLVVMDSTVGETSVQLRARVEDDGGAPVTALTITREGGQQCVATAADCSFDNLPANREYAFVARASNPHGTRELNIAVKTLMRRPAAPTGSITVAASTETITVDAHPLDRFNATLISASCWGWKPGGGGVQNTWATQTALRYAGEPIVYTHDTSERKTVECRIHASNLEKGISATTLIKPGVPTTNGGDDNPTGGTDGDGGTVTTVPVVNPITLSVRAERFARGRYVVRWTARSRDGRSVTVTVPKFGSRKCVPRTRTSCVVVGLRSGKTYTVVFAGSTSKHTKKVKFSIKAR